jgi:transposase-like protein
MSSAEWRPAIQPRNCLKCKSANVEVRTVTSFDEAHEDDNFRCLDCKYDWWVDGPDY